LLLATGLALLIGTVRLALSLHGLPEFPIYDEWSVIDGIAVPAAAGTFDPGYLVAPHNEHVLVWTKLLDWMQLRISDNQFDARPAGLAVSLVSGIVAALLLAGGTRYVPIGRLPFLVAGVALAVLPYAWENLTAGWGMSFVFLILGAIATLRLAACGHGAAAALLLLPAVLLSALAMGSGWVAPALAIGVVCARARRGDLPFALAIGFIVASCSGIALAAWALRTVHPGAHPPVPGALAYLQIALLSFAFVPAALFAWRTFRRQDLASGQDAARGWRTDCFVAALAVWGYLHAVAMIVFRPEFRIWFPVSRYMDILAIAMLANVACALQLAARDPKQISGRALQPAVRIFAMVTVLAAPLPIAIYRWQVERWIQTEALLMRYVHHADPGAIAQADSSILPYPDRDMLKVYLDDPRVRRILGDRIGDRRSPAAFVSGSRRVEGWLGDHARVLMPAAIMAALVFLAAAFHRRPATLAAAPMLAIEK
jgi:hypothetical protein